MKRILGSILALGIGLSPLTLPLMVEPSWGQTQNSQRQQLEQLFVQAMQQSKQGQSLKSIETWQRVIPIARQVKDRKIEARALLMLGFNYNKIGQPQKALEYYKQALPIFKVVGDRSWEAISLNNIGEVYRNIGEPQKALEYYNQALPILKALGDRAGVATALNNIGWVYHSIGERQKALDYFNQALPISRELGDRAGIATTLSNIGGVYEKIGQSEKALDYYKQALPISREVGDRVGVAVTLNNIGAVYDSIGERQKALDYYNQALPIRKEVGDRAGEATTLNNIGLVYDSIGQPQKALDYYNQALSISKAVNDRAGVAKKLNNIGAVYRSIGQPQEALKSYNQALPIFKDIGDRPEEATTLNNIGLVYETTGEPLKALEYYNQALAISREVGNRAGEATTLNNIGAVYFRIGQPQKALDYFNQVLPILKAVGDRAVEATTLNNIGRVYRSIGQPQKALDYYNQALPIIKDVGDRAVEAITLNNIGVVYRDTKRPTEAIEKLEESVEITLEMRGGLQRENRQNFLEIQTARAVALVDLLIEQNQPDRAYEWINRVTTAELADYTRLIDAKVANPEAQKAIDDWNQKNQQLQFLRQQLQQNFSQERSRQMRDLEAKVNKQAEDISRNFPVVAELFETKPADIDQLKKNMPSGTVIIHPVLLTEFNKIAIFVITKDKLTVTQKNINLLELKRFMQKPEFKKLIQEEEFKKRIKKLGFDPDRIPDRIRVSNSFSEISLVLLTGYGVQLENRNDTNYLETSQKLYDILIRPVEDKILTASHTQLSIIAPNELRYLPFETLYDSQTDNYLIEKYPVNYLTRISTRSWQDRTQVELISPLKNIPYIPAIAVIATIGGLGFLVFRKFGIVAAGVLVVIASGTTFWLISSRTASVLAIGNPKPIEPYALEGSEAEVKEVSKIIAGSKFYIRQDATLDTFKTQALRFPFLHLATHGCFQQEGCKNLNMKANTILFADQEYDIADAALLGLQNTELLALSACQTAKETDLNGQQISGVAYVFERAGAKAVIASLWIAPDTKTKEIAIQFYQNIKKGKSKSEAMRQAKLSQIKSHPFFWSPLILIGDGQ
ncbi:Tetratricopeptide TPR_1 repeat-containing protein [Oscillatoria nigro-viridis PCC 7112]|uniref:Tetratricopeptide TPR_1 repeat-containing protein n=1 Tax=Phormidium nigroviride PCC 7112 TaxID=179408 RepID=K9VGE1_9CYAN|nr:tetratricopeptide repeat protein [Oscillatoria nigro-viridis]AFZ06569.1 Tetratricopeptide TPR_1 repeat-containing protein [Oscillatoria nigro-viridis PCC 7112]